MKPDLVAIVSARRGISALRQLLSQLPSTFASPIVCLVESDPALVELLQSASRLKVRWAEPGVRLEKSTVYVSPPGASLVVRSDERLSLTPYGVESTGINPVDHFLMSAARYDAGLLSLVLAGIEGDGVAGCKAVREHGGNVLVLDRATARYWGTAEPLVRAGATDRVLTLTELADAMRAFFPCEDILRRAEIQIEVGSLLEAALHVSGTALGLVSRLERDALGVLVQRGLTMEALERLAGMPVSAESACGRAVLEKTRLVVRDVEAAGVDPDFRDTARILGIRAVHAIPLLKGNGNGLLQGESLNGPVAGVLATLFAQPHAVVPAEAGSIDQIGARIAPFLARLS